MALLPDGSYEYGVNDTANILGQQALKADQERSRRKLGTPPPPNPEPNIYTPLIDEASFIPMPATPVAGATNSTKPVSSKPKLTTGQIVALVGCLLIAIVVVSVSGGNSVMLLLAVLGLLYAAYKIVIDRPVVSTGPEMDAVLIAKYNRDVERYKRKLKGRRFEQSMAANAGIRNTAFNQQPKPPRKPILSTDKR